MIVYKLPVPFTSWDDKEPVVKLAYWVDLPVYIDTAKAYYIDDWYDGGIVLRCTVSGDPLYLLKGGSK